MTLTPAKIIIPIFIASLSLFLLDVPTVQAQANLVGIRVGSTMVPGPWSCNRTPAGAWGTRVNTPNITGSWSSAAIKAPCIENILFDVNMGQQDYFDRLRIRLANLPIPAETDIRFCIREWTTTGAEACTPWASSGDNIWLDSGISGGPDDPDGLQIKIESRAMPGRSITDMRVRAREYDNYFPYGNIEGNWATTPWRSAGGGESAEATIHPGSGTTNSVRVGLQVRMTPLALANLVPQNLTQTGTLTTGQQLTFSGVVQNTGQAISTSTTARFCVDNLNCATNATGAFSSPSVPVLAVGATSGALSGSWTATLGTHTVYFCVVGVNCIQTASFNVVANQDCTLDGVTVLNGQSRLFYNTTSVPYNQSCTGVNGSGVPYSQNRTCNNGVLSGSASYSHSSCIVSPTPPHSDITLSANMTLVREGSSILLTWDGGNSEACTLSGSNGFTSTAISGTGVSSGPINVRSTFSLTCTLGSSSKTAPPINVTLIPTVIEI